MFLKVAEFEFRYQLRNPVFWVTAAFIFLVTFGSMAFDLLDMGGGGSVYKNSAHATLLKYLAFSVFMMFVTTAFVSNVIVRDDDSGYGPILRATPISKFDYLYGRFTGAFLIAALALAMVPLAIWLGSLAPWLDDEVMGPNRLSHHLYGYFLLALPNLFFTAAVFFALATVTRSMMATYLGVVAFIILYFTAISVASSQPSLRDLAHVLEPFGLNAYSGATRYWTGAERNVLLPPLSGTLLYNRILWTGVSVLFLGAAYLLYRFADKGVSPRKRKSGKALPETADESIQATGFGRLPSAQFGPRATAALLRARTAIEMRQVFKSPAFIVLMGLGLFSAVGTLFWDRELFGVLAFPLPEVMIPLLEKSFTIIPIVIAIFYAGELVWRERDRKMNEIIDAAPLPNWAFLVPKGIAVALVLISIVLLSAAAAFAVTLIEGEADLEIGKYLLWYVLPMSVDMMLIAALAIFVQSVSPSKYLGWGIMVIFLIFRTQAGSLGLDHNLYIYGGTPQTPLSGLNGAGTFWIGAWVFRLYWGAFAILLLIISHLLWGRGTETRLKPRLKALPKRLRGGPGVMAAVALGAFVATGAYAFYNTNVLNHYRTDADVGEMLAAYEKSYLRFENLPQPTIVHVEMDVALHPQERRAVTRGAYRLRNATTAPIREVHFSLLDFDLKYNSASLEGARLVRDDRRFGYRIYRLDEPLLPGQERVFRFETLRWHRGFTNEEPETKLVQNGTFLNNHDVAPTIGINRRILLSDRSVRKQYGLAPELRPARLEDLSATRKSRHGDGWTTADITVSTSADQTPIAPGKKVSDVVRNGRRIARFVSNAPIINFYSFQSARYAERHRLHRGVDLAVYYHPPHRWNVDRMLSALRAALDYYQASFGPYQFAQAYVVESPSYRASAQAYPHTIAFSEASGFILDFRDDATLDYLSYGTAHELAHQYWGHQLTGADMQGSRVLAETLAQYSALMVMRRMYGEEKVRRFLKVELQLYLGSRVREAVEEVPLARAENEGDDYILYNKGAVVMYLLMERLGEERVNRALRSLLDRYRFRGPPYPRSVDLIAALREQAQSPEQQALITDLFERITFYDLKTVEPRAARRSDGKWEVTVPVEARKLYADGRGSEKETPLGDRIDIGLFSAEPGTPDFRTSDVIKVERHEIRSGRQVLRFIVDKKPAYVGIDPYNSFIDRNWADNLSQLPS